MCDLPEEDEENKVLACLHTLKTVPHKAAAVRSLLVTYVDAQRTKDLLFHTIELCKAMRVLPGLTDFRVRADDPWDFGFQCIVDALRGIPFRLRVLHIPSSWARLRRLDDSVYRHRASLHTVAISGNGRNAMPLVVTFERRLRGTARARIFSYNRTHLDSAIDVIGLYPAAYLVQKGWAASYVEALVRAFADATACDLQQWHITPAGIRTLGIYVERGDQLAALGPFMDLVRSAFPGINSLELHGVVPGWNAPTLDPRDVAPVIKAFPDVMRLSLGGWSSRTLGQDKLAELIAVVRTSGCTRLTQITLPRDETVFLSPNGGPANQAVQ
ncbi:hypothetical protein AURDEDRAFT_160951 [Auricularia subglabra TFB-10046 SS5]|nr:hypothetical protein AURDEDRAFT_160951 [Auricularia subglabra TFB-10046 SS5]